MINKRSIKDRHNPDKPQNKYGGNYDCEHYDTFSDGKEFCHEEAGWSTPEHCRWYWKTVDDKLVCKGNRHNCYKMKMKWYASLTEKEKAKYENN